MGNVTRLGHLVLIVSLVWPLAPLMAQRQDIQAAAAQFNKLPVGARYEIQMLLMAAGQAEFVANEEFSRRLFDAISSFQRGNGFVATGALNSQQLDRLRAAAEPNLARWNLQRVHHPLVGTPLWIPLGFNLAAKRTSEGVEYSSRNGSNIAFGYFRGNLISTVASRSYAHAAPERGGGNSRFRAWLFCSCGGGRGQDVYALAPNCLEAALGFKTAAVPGRAAPRCRSLCQHAPTDFDVGQRALTQPTVKRAHRERRALRERLARVVDFGSRD